MSEVKTYDSAEGGGVEECRNGVGGFVEYDDYAKLEAEAQALREEVAVLRLDAERFRWLRDKCHLFEHYRSMKWRPDAFEQEIDAQMKRALLDEGKEGDGHA